MNDLNLDETLSRHVSGVVGQLQAAYLSDDQRRFTWASATLARLRRAVGREPGDDPMIWETIFGAWPSSLPVYGDTPTQAERAGFTAVTLYSIHQQSKRRDGMHRPGRSLGGAVGELSRRPGMGDNVRRRFDMIATAQSVDEIVYHARGLITQLRGADPAIALDYGMLAGHLRKLQHPSSATTVRLRWGRDYHQVGKPRPTVDSAGIVIENQENPS